MRPRSAESGRAGRRAVLAAGRRGDRRSATVQSGRRSVGAPAHRRATHSTAGSYVTAAAADTYAALTCRS